MPRDVSRGRELASGEVGREGQGSGMGPKHSCPSRRSPLLQFLRLLAHKSTFHLEPTLWAAPVPMHHSTWNLTPVPRGKAYCFYITNEENRGSERLNPMPRATQQVNSMTWPSMFAWILLSLRPILCVCPALQVWMSCPPGISEPLCHSLHPPTVFMVCESWLLCCSLLSPLWPV